MQSTRRTDSSAWRRAPMRSPTSTRWSLPRRTPSSQTLRTTWMTTPSGGKVSTRIRRRTQLTGWASRGTAKSPQKRALIRTAASLRRQSTARAFLRNSTIRRAFRFPQWYSAAAVQKLLRWYISPLTGNTACL